jgi:hypothetical protein
LWPTAAPEREPSCRGEARSSREPRRLRDLALSLDLPAPGVPIPLAFIDRRTPRALDAR